MPPRDPPKPAATEGRGPASSLWTLILSIIASLVFLGALVGLLVAFDGKLIFDSGVITLNTLIAILSAVNKATIIYAVSSAICQSKWAAFSGERRRLLDFARIDSASQGPLGSLYLLFNTRVKRIGIIRLGAMLTVLALALDPFAQQLLQYRQSTTFISDASTKTAITRAGRYSLGTEIRTGLVRLNFTEGNDTRLALPSSPPPTQSDAEFTMQSAIMFGLSQPLSAVSQQAKFACPSGNCTYPSFTSLSVCNTCTDLTPRITRNEVDPRGRLNISLDPTGPGQAVDDRLLLRYSLPNGLFLDNSAKLTMFGTTNASRTLTHQDIKTLIWSQTILRHPPGTNTSLLDIGTDSAVTATECALYYCINSYTSSVLNGILIETTTPLQTTISPSSWEVRPSLPGQKASVLPASRVDSLSYHPRFSYPPRTDLVLNSAFNLSQAAINSVSSFMQRTFAACTGVTNCSSTLEAVAENWTPLNGFYMTTQVGSQYAPSAAQVFWAAGNVSDVFEAIATSMSNALRTGADEDAEGGKVILGETGVVTTLYRVDWRWIVLHAVVVGLALVVVLWVVVEAWVRQREVPVWGSSALAVLARGEMVGGLLGGTKSVEEMEGRAREVEVALLGHEEVELIERGGRDGWKRQTHVRDADIR